MGFTKDIIGTNESVGGINLFEKVQSTQPATPYTAGLMSATDKSKLDSLENYVHPDSGVVPGKYMQVDVDEQGHVVAGRELQNSTLEDYRIKDAYIDLSDNSIVLGSHRIKPITPSDKVRWEQIVDTPNTLKEFGVTDVALSDGTINIGGDLITPLTADSQIAADKIAGVIDLKNIPVGAMERCVVVEDDAARFALTTNDVQKGDTVKVINPTPTMYMVVDESKLDSADGYVVYSAGNANSVPWGGITDKPDQFYTLPKADINTLGGVIIGDNITVDADGKISTHSPYSLPQASDTVLGGVKIGENILEQPDGTINISTATTNTPGVVKIGDNINIDDDGTISTEKYQLPTATNMRLGGVRIGKYLSVDSEGLLNATGVPITASKTDMGGVIIGENIDIDENGKISVTLPTKTSELENDSEFITTENLSLHNNDENAHASKFEAMHGQLVNVYNNVAEMKQSTRLKVGMAAKTLGYYSANDGGGAYYTIREKADGDVDDGGSVHELANGLVAELIVENGIVNVKQFGAKGDGVTDDTVVIQNALNAGSTVIFPDGIYMVNAVKNLKLVSRENMHIIISPNAEVKSITTSATNYYIFALLRCKNITIDGGGKITGDVDTHTGTDGEWGYGIQIYHSSNILIDNLELSKLWGDGVYIGDYIDGTHSENVTVRNCYIHHNRRQGISVGYGRDILIDSCLITDIAGTAPQSGIDIETEGNASTFEAQKNIHVRNTIIKNCAGYSIITIGLMENINITDCILDKYLVTSLKGNVSINNCNLSGEIRGEKSFDGASLTIENCTADGNVILDIPTTKIHGGKYANIFKIGSGEIKVDDCKTGRFNSSGNSSVNNSTMTHIDISGSDNRFNGCTITQNITSTTGANASFNDCNISARIWGSTFNILSFEHCRIISDASPKVTITQEYTLNNCSFIVTVTNWYFLITAKDAECVFINNDFNFDTIQTNSDNVGLIGTWAKTVRVMGNVFRNANAISYPIHCGSSASPCYLLQSQNNIALDTARCVGATMGSGGKKYIVNDITSQTTLS